MEDELAASEPAVEWDGYDESWNHVNDFSFDSFSENEVDDRLAKYKTLESDSGDERTLRYEAKTPLDDSTDDEDDANSMESYTIGGRCLQTHVMRMDSDNDADFDDDDDDEEGEGEGDSGVVEEPTYGHLVADASPPDEDAAPINDQDLDGEPCISPSTSNFNFGF